MSGANNPVQLLLCYALQFYVLAILAVIVLSWFPLAPGGAAATVWGVLRRITDPVLMPLRKLVPPIGGRFDLSPMIVLFVVRLVLQPLVC